MIVAMDGHPLERQKTDGSSDIAELRELLSYDPDTGELVWLPRDRSHFKSYRSYVIFNIQFAGKRAFVGTQKDGYRRGGVRGRVLMAHRVAWALYYGYWPNQIDHIDGCRTNNKIQNLRDATPSQNSLNRAMGKNNTSGVVGVKWCKRFSRWKVTMGYQGQKKYLGSFVSFEEAVEVRRMAEKECGVSFRHGK